DFDFTLNLYNENVPSGEFKFQITAFDTIPHETTEEITISVDKESPIFTLFQPNDNGTGFVSEPQIGKVKVVGMVSDNYALTSLSPNNYVRIFPSDDENHIIYSSPILQTPFSFDTVDTMDESIDSGSYTILLSYEDVNGNIGTKRVLWTAEKGDTNTYLQIDSPKDNFIAADSLTVSGAAMNAFSDIDYVQYIITKRTDIVPINQTTAVGRMSVGQAGSFSEILSLKSMENIVSGEYNLRVTAYAKDGSSSQTAIVPFEFASELADFDFIDGTDGAVLNGDTPVVSAYLNGDITVDVAAATLSLSDMEYAIMQGGTYLQNWTSMIGSSSDIYDSSSKHYHRYTASVDVSAIHLDNGSFIMKVRARLSDMGQWREISRPLYFDKSVPDVRITSHKENDISTGINGAVTITGTCSDNMGLKSVKIKDSVSNTWTDVSGTPAIWSYIVSTDNDIDDITIEEKYGVGVNQTKDVIFTVLVTDIAGNENTKSCTLRIDPNADKPVLTFLNPPNPSVEEKVSGTFTMSATIMDDDFPLRGMNASMKICQYKAGYSADDYITRNEPVIEQRYWAIDAVSGDLNLAYIIDTESAKYSDLTSYVILLSGNGWKNKNADTKMALFFVDKTAPVIILDDYDETNVNKKYFTDSIHFSGYVQYKDNSLLAETSPFILQYIDSAGITRIAEIGLGAVMNENTHKKQLFNIVINSNGTSSGFVNGKEPNLTWSDDEWGNSTKLFTFRATSTTAQTGVKTVRVYLDNHTPTMTIKSPSDGYLFDQEGTQSFALIFSVNDEPPVGSSYSLNFRDNVQIQYKYSGASSWITNSS
ncbi:MAG: hypothetical protein J6Y01_07450, partial [Spirochaetales bacterium]|nr:hypothetical protein [Spirochaetales bacterium]